MNNDELRRYNRHIILPEIGIEGQEKLKAARVLVIGAGGLGCPVLLYLTAAGVGEIGIVDDDVVDESNLQRQVLYATGDIKKNKADTAVENLKAQNPHIKFTGYKERLTSANALKIIAAYDIVIDGSDNFPTRYLVNDACVILNKPLVFGSVFKFEGQVSVFNYKNGPTYRCLYPQPPAPGEVPDCSEIGVMGVLPGMVGLLQANETIKIITGLGQVLNGKVLQFNTLTMSFETFSFELNPENKKITALADYQQFCGMGVQEISPEELKLRTERHDKFQLIDVREESEYNMQNWGGRLIPLGQLKENLHRISTKIPVIVHCQSGVRSKKAAEILISNGFNEVYSVKGAPY
jgi:sulfur-carrier protein adenylyltransferase/sulfurtransferase